MHWAWRRGIVPMQVEVTRHASPHLTSGITCTSSVWKACVLTWQVVKLQHRCWSTWIGLWSWLVCSEQDVEWSSLQFLGQLDSALISIERGYFHRLVALLCRLLSGRVIVWAHLSTSVLIAHRYSMTWWLSVHRAHWPSLELYLRSSSRNGMIALGLIQVKTSEHVYLGSNYQGHRPVLWHLTGRSSLSSASPWMSPGIVHSFYSIFHVRAPSLQDRMPSCAGSTLTSFCSQVCWSIARRLACRSWTRRNSESTFPLEYSLEVLLNRDLAST